MFEAQEARSDFLHLRYAILLIVMLIAAIAVAMTARYGWKYSLLLVDGRKTVTKNISYTRTQVHTSVWYLYIDDERRPRTERLRYEHEFVPHFGRNHQNVEVMYSPTFGVSAPVFLMAAMESAFTIFAGGVLVLLVCSVLGYFGIASIFAYYRERPWY